MKMSDCCHAYPVGASEDMGLCPICHEHCEYIPEYEDDDQTDEGIPLENDNDDYTDKKQDE